MMWKNKALYLVLFQISSIQSAQLAHAVPLLIASPGQVVPSSPRNSLPNCHDAFLVPAWREPLSKVNPRILFPSDEVPSIEKNNALPQTTFRPGYFYIPVTEETEPQVESMLQDPESSCKVTIVQINGQEFYEIYDPSLREDQRVPSSLKKRKADGDHPDSLDSKKTKLPTRSELPAHFSLRSGQLSGVYRFGGAQQSALATLPLVQPFQQNETFARDARTRARAALNN